MKCSAKRINSRIIAYSSPNCYRFFTNSDISYALPIETSFFYWQLVIMPMCFVFLLQKLKIHRDSEGNLSNRLDNMTFLSSEICVNDLTIEGNMRIPETAISDFRIESVQNCLGQCIQILFLLIDHFAFQCQR